MNKWIRIDTQKIDANIYRNLIYNKNDIQNNEEKIDYLICSQTSSHLGAGGDPSIPPNLKMKQKKNETYQKDKW